MRSPLSQMLVVRSSGAVTVFSIRAKTAKQYDYCMSNEHSGRGCKNRCKRLLDEQLRPIHLTNVFGTGATKNLGQGRAWKRSALRLKLSGGLVQR